MKYVKVKCKLFSEKPSEFLKIENYEDLNSYIEDLKIQNDITLVKEKRGIKTNKDASMVLKEAYHSIYQGKLVNECLTYDFFVNYKKEIIEKYIEQGKIVYVNKKGGILVQNENFEEVE